MSNRLLERFVRPAEYRYLSGYVRYLEAPIRQEGGRVFDEETRQRLLAALAVELTLVTELPVGEVWMEGLRVKFLHTLAHEDLHKGQQCKLRGRSVRWEVIAVAPAEPNQTLEDFIRRFGTGLTGPLLIADIEINECLALLSKDPSQDST